jgi:hypothetical protein
MICYCVFSSRLILFCNLFSQISMMLRSFANLEIKFSIYQSYPTTAKFKPMANTSVATVLHH